MNINDFKSLTPFQRELILLLEKLIRAINGGLDE